MLYSESNILDIEHFRSVRYAEGLSTTVLPCADSNHASRLDAYCAGIAALADENMRPADAIMHFFWVIAENMQDTPDALMHTHMHNFGILSEPMFIDILSPIVGHHMTLLKGRKILNTP